MRVRIVGRILVGLTLALGNATLSGAYDFFEPVQPPRTFQTMAHRGLMNQAPENTRPALEMAIEDFIEWVEVDVRLTQDGKHVLCHDSKVDGKSNGKGEVGGLTLAQLQALDWGSWFAPRFAGEKILTLTECLNLAKGRINLYLDCKKTDPELLSREILAAGMERQVVVFDDLEVLEKIREHSQGKIPIMPKWHPEMGLETWIEEVHPEAVEIDASEVTPEACRAFHQKGIKVQAKVLDDWDNPDWWDRCREAGVDWYQTDLAEELIPHFVERGISARPVMISLHRGAKRYAPENTLPAFEKAIRMGVDYIEFDVRTTSDRKFYLLHDGSLDRTTNGKGSISHHSAAEVAQLDAGSWFSSLFKGMRAPTLEALLETVKGQVNLYFDAKDIPAAELVRAVKKAGMVERTVVYQSPEYLMDVKRLEPGIRALPPLHSPEAIAEYTQELKPYAVDCAWEILSEDVIRKCHAGNILVFSDSIGEHETLDDYFAAIKWGIDLIQTDHPLRVFRAIELYTASGKK